jgi:hypothetical protein
MCIMGTLVCESVDSYAQIDVMHQERNVVKASQAHVCLSWTRRKIITRQGRI